MFEEASFSIQRTFYTCAGFFLGMGILIYAFIAIALLQHRRTRSFGTGCAVFVIVSGVLMGGGIITALNGIEAAELVYRQRPEQQITILQQTLDAQNLQRTQESIATQEVLDREMTQASQLATIDALVAQIDEDSSEELATLSALATREAKQPTNTPVATVRDNGLVSTVVALRQSVSSNIQSLNDNSSSDEEPPTNTFDLVFILIKDTIFQFCTATFLGLIGLWLSYLQLKQK